MKLSQYFTPTLREAPNEAEIVSHKLMLRAAMIKRLASGIYIYMPLGHRVLKKIENIVRTSMNEAGAVELLMPSVQPAELWQESGRWSKYGKELLRIQDRHNRDFCLGPTHEEVITDLAKSTVHSYKQLPLNLYQIQTKFRDEVRPRFGLIRGREFIMKDAYSFDIDDEASQASYGKMAEAYRKIFERCGLNYKMVEADTGAIGGNYSHEFMVLANTGEDAVISCSNCDYAANIEKAPAMVVSAPTLTEADMQEVHTPGAHTVEEVAGLLGVSVEQVVKTIIVNTDGKLMAILVRGDHEANLIKLKNHLNAANVEMATPAEIISTGAAVGFSGPAGLNIPIYADSSVEGINNQVIGAGKKDYHYTGAKFGRDYQVTATGDFRNAQEGDKCCNCCEGSYVITRGIEVGHIFKLGTRYSESMQAKFLDKNGKQQYLYMGCYGIGVSRIAAAAIEQNHDDDGIIWPVPIAPFEVVVVPLNSNEPEIMEYAEKLYNSLKKNGVDVIFDDRNERAGVKLSDADLIGYPLRVTVGKKTFADNLVEITVRRGKQTAQVHKDSACQTVMDTLKTII